MCNSKNEILNKLLQKNIQKFTSLFESLIKHDNLQLMQMKFDLKENNDIDYQC